MRIKRGSRPKFNQESLSVANRAHLNEDTPTLRSSAWSEAPTLASLGGATLRGALISPCGTAVLQIGAVETLDCLDVSVFPLCLLVRGLRRNVEQGFTECRPTGSQRAETRIIPGPAFSRDSSPGITRLRAHLLNPIEEEESSPPLNPLFTRSSRGEEA